VQEEIILYLSTVQVVAKYFGEMTYIGSKIGNFMCPHGIIADGLMRIRRLYEMVEQLKILHSEDRSLGLEGRWDCLELFCHRFSYQGPDLGMLADLDLGIFAFQPSVLAIIT
jgi:hypothetical protein